MQRRLKGLVAAAALMALAGPANAQPQPQPAWRDLNHNGQRDPYEDARLPDEARVRDLVARMTVEEKAGTLLHGTLPAIGSPFGASDKGYDLPAIEKLVRGRGITSLISRLAMPPAAFAAQNNEVQKIAEASRLGIPVTISSDPRNHFSVVQGASVSASGFSQWPEPLGLAALGDVRLLRHFGAVAAREYRAVGLTMALSPQADLATEPRWPRAIATFGANPARVSAMAGAYVAGFQGSARGLTAGGVATVVKHFVGYGAEPEGFDAHNAYGAYVRLDQASFAQHLAAFAGPLKAGSAGVMPTYPVIDGVRLGGKPLEPVGAGFNKALLRGLLRGRLGFEGLVVSDWGIVNDCSEACSNPTAEVPQRPWNIAMPWGVEGLTQEQRIVKGIAAGIDQFGGFDNPGPILAAIGSGAISAAQLDASVRRALLVKFRLGLFDNPFVDEAAAARIVGAPEVLAEARRVQARAIVALESAKGALPLAAGRKVWLYGIDAAAATAAGLIVVTDPTLADAALLRLAAPSEKLHPNHFFGAMQNEGRLDFRDGDAGYEALKAVTGKLPVMVAVDLDRAAVLTNVRDKTDVLLGVFGASDAALLDVVTGRVKAEGRLPVELPRSMAAVEAQRPDRANDSRNPLYPAGYSLGAARRR